jgi:glycosyltransferase
MTDSRVARPILSIITSTFNAAQHLPDLIASIREQDHRDVEWIIVDGASQDHTMTLVAEASDVVSQAISEADQGIYDAWNKGVAAARGEWIAFMGADDYYLPGALQACCRMAEQASAEHNLIVATIHWVNESDTRIVRTIAQPWDWKAMRKWMNIGHPGTLHRRTLFELSGGFDISYRCAADYDFFLRIGPQVNALFQPMPLARVRIGGTSQQTKALREAQQVRQRNLGLSPLASGGAYALARVKMVLRGWIERLKG